MIRYSVRQFFLSIKMSDNTSDEIINLFNKLDNGDKMYEHEHRKVFSMLKDGLIIIYGKRYCHLTKRSFIKCQKEDFSIDITSIDLNLNCGYSTIDVKSRSCTFYVIKFTIECRINKLYVYTALRYSDLSEMLYKLNYRNISIMERFKDGNNIQTIYSRIDMWQSSFDKMLADYQNINHTNKILLVRRIMNIIFNIDLNMMKNILYQDVPQEKNEQRHLLMSHGPQTIDDTMYNL